MKQIAYRTKMKKWRKRVPQKCVARTQVEGFGGFIPANVGWKLTGAKVAKRCTTYKKDPVNVKMY